MKQLIFGLAVIASLLSCSKVKEEADKCVDSAKKYTDAANAYAHAQTKANCEAYKAALTVYLSTACATPDQKIILQQTANALTCE